MTHELVSADAFVRSRLTGHFIRPQNEAAYREWHSLKSHNILSAMSLTLGVLFTAGAAAAISNQDSLKGRALQVFPSARPLLMTTTFIARAIPIVTGILLLVPATRRAWTGKTYNMFAFTSMLLPILVESGAPAYMVAVPGARAGDGVTYGVTDTLGWPRDGASR